MVPEEWQRADALDRYWDALLRGETPREDVVDSVAAAVIAHLAARRTSPNTDASQRKLRRQITAHARVLEDSMQTIAFPEDAVVPHVALTPLRLPVRPAPSRSGWLFAQFATLLLLVSLGLMFWSFGPARQAVEQPTIVPAAMFASPATIASSVTVETILDAMVETLPTGRAIVGVNQWTLRPSSTALTLPAFNGPAIVVVEAGEVTATQAGTETRLAKRDTFAPADQQVALQLTGSEEATLYVVYIVPSLVDSPNSDGENLFWGHDPVTQRPEFLITTSSESFPGGPGRLVLERLTLPPGSALPSEEANPFMWTEVGSGAVGLTLEGEGLPFRWNSGQERTFRQGQRLPIVLLGARATLRNTDDVELVLYRLSLTPGEAGS